MTGCATSTYGQVVNMSDRTLPKAFSGTYSNTRVILDCTEMRVERASSFRCQSSTFSSYKHYNTAKGLIGISPTGAITFASDLFGGRVSDRTMVKESCILNKLDRGDGVMADRGFLIEEACQQQGIQLHTPSFMRGRAQLTLPEEHETLQCAPASGESDPPSEGIQNFGQHVSIEDGSIDEPWIICCYLTNFLLPLTVERTCTSLAKKNEGDETTESGDVLDDDDASDCDSPSRYVSPALQRTDCAQITPELEPGYPGAFVHHLLLREYCQSSLDGRNGSNACTVIAACAARFFLSRTFFRHQ